MLKRTLNEWEAITLEEIFELSHTILYSGFDDPQELQKKVCEIVNKLTEQHIAHGFPKQNKVIELYPKNIEEEEEENFIPY